MTPNPPEPSEGSSLPPRHRMRLSELNKDTTEQDLWDLDDDDDIPSEALIDLPKKKEVSPKTSLQTREIRPALNTPSDAPEESVYAKGSKLKSAPPGDFDDLDHEEDSPAPAPKRPVMNVIPASLEKILTPVEEVEEDEFTPHVAPDAKPISLRPALGLSTLERLGLIGLVVCILAGGIWFLTQSLGGLPKEADLHQKPDLPIKGKLLTVTSADTFWREPIEQGENIDTVRRGTELIPVTILKLEGGPAAIRIFFVNADGSYVGDPVTRSVSGKSTIEIPATAGFDDKGMHAAYRTGLSNPWSIEIFEAPSTDAPSDAFVKILKMTISPKRQ